MTTLLWWIAGGSLVLASAGFSAPLAGYHQGQRRLWEAGFCPPVVRLDLQTKEWFRQTETPPDDWDYLNRVGRQQEAIEKGCR